MEQLILVNKKDKAIGFQEKLKAHQLGQLHRAFSIFIFNSTGRLMLQRRSLEKYHCGGLWSNTCCGHPRPKELLEKAIYRRLNEEMGFDCHLQKNFEFIYKVQFDNDLWENEYVHVFFGQYDGKPEPNSEEVSAWKWIELDNLKKEIQHNPEKFTYWMKKELAHPKFDSEYKHIPLLS
jgi:isopentenyl-diphosphate Delta-isomerase